MGYGYWQVITTASILKTIKELLINFF